MAVTMKCTLTLLALVVLVAAVSLANAAPTTYSPKDFSRLKGMPGFSDQALELHFTLYQGYVKNTNVLLEDLGKIAANTPAYAEMKRRLGWEFNGMRLHELYFGNLGGNGQIAPDSKIAKRLADQFGSLENWATDFKATGTMRGIGWVVLYEDPVTGRLINVWINEHDVGHLAGGRPLLIMDVFEHAFIPDYGLKKGEYIEAFFKNIDWQAVESRLGQ
jgi:Fe-Mn family superoxide dismutase